MKKIALVTNIPAPYRVPIYNIIEKDKIVDLTVLFSAGNEPNRKWNLVEFKFKHVFLKENFFDRKDDTNFIHNNIDVFTHLRRLNPDVVITTGYNPTHLYSMLYALCYRKKVVLMTDGFMLSEKGLTWLHRAIRKIAVKISSAFIGPGVHTKKLFEHYGADKNKIFQSHLCVDNARFKNNVKFNERPYHLMFSGQFIERKMPLFFVDIVVALKSRVPNLKVLILGDGPLRSDMISRLQENCIDYDWPGFVCQEDLPAFYRNSKLFLFPTKLDPWGVVVNEALASGTPVLTTNAAGVVGDLLKHNSNGFVLGDSLTCWVDSIMELLSDEAKWGELSSNSESSVQRFNYNSAAEGIIKASLSCYEKR